VHEAVPLGLALDEQAIGPDISQQVPGGDLLGQAAKGGPDLVKNVLPAEVGHSALHHRVGQPAQHGLLCVTAHFAGEILGFLSAPEHDLADLGVKLGTAAGKLAAVEVHIGDHRDQQWVDRQFAQCGLLVQAPQQVVSPCFSANANVLFLRAGTARFDRPVPAAHEPVHLSAGEAADLDTLLTALYVELTDRIIRFAGPAAAGREGRRKSPTPSSPA
jgi:hypothetical protein